VNFLDDRLPERFWRKVTPCPISGCWLWFAARTRDDYGHIEFEGRLWRAHRLAYARLVGDIPAELTIDHLCRVTVCCNPMHMEPVTNRINTLRGNTLAAANVRKRYCPKGHELSGDNLEPDQLKRGKRSCHRCALAARRAYRARTKARRVPRATQDA